VSVSARIRVLTNMYSEEEIQLTYLGTAGNVMGDEFRVPGEITNLQVKDALGSIDHSKRRIGNLTVVRFYFRTPLSPGKERKITISYISANFTSKSGNLWKYSTTFLAGSKVDRWQVILELPANVEVFLPSGTSLAALKRIAYESGRTVCEWTASDVDRLTVAIGHSPLQTTDKGPVLAYLAIAGVIMVAALAGYLLRTAYAPSKTPKAVDIAIKLLEDRERRIVRELASGQKLTQAELVKATKLSKATVSRAVVELERRKIVTREPSGRVIRVRLRDWILQS